MIIEKLSIQNLFSYYGVNDFDLTPPESGNRNVALVWGRNGFGKTSFINSLKLLLGGVSKELRTSIQAGSMVSREQYLLGKSDEWVGIFNSQARAFGSKDFSVSAQMHEDNGIFFVERKWKLDGSSVHELLSIRHEFGGKLVELIDKDSDPEGDARAFLQARLPENIIPFFIYDGEKIQQLAEANRLELLRQIEQLLDLADVDTIKEYLGRNLSKWRSSANNSSQYSLNIARREVEIIEDKLALLINERDNNSEQIQEIDYSIKRLDALITARRQFALQSEETSLTAKRQVKSDALQDKTSSFFESFTRDAPLVLHSKLLSNAIGELEKLTNHPNRRLKDEIERISSSLPQRLFFDPPHPSPSLANEQVDFFQRKLQKILDSYRPDSIDAMAGLFQISSVRAESALRVVEDYSNSTRQQQQWIKHLADIRKLKQELNDIDRKLNDVSNLAPQEIEAFQQRLGEKADLEKQRHQLENKLGELREREKNLNLELNKAKDKRRQEEAKLVISTQAKGKLGLGEKVSKVLDTYRELLKKRRREEIEISINKRFKDVMSSNTLIDYIQVNDDFSLHFFDASKNVIGMANISAGMKQLVAQALLWGLKDVSQKNAPIIVDTPLARIDRQHQENLITKYYPNAGQQVIILPTDAEIDREKYSLLQPFIYKEYCLNNPTGNETQVVEGSYYNG